MSDSFNKDGWILDFADTTRSLHLLCEQWLYVCEDDSTGGCNGE